MTHDISQLKGLKIKAYVTDRYAEDRDEHIMVRHTVEFEAPGYGFRKIYMLDAINPKDALRRFNSFVIEPAYQLERKRQGLKPETFAEYRERTA